MRDATNIGWRHAPFGTHSENSLYPLIHQPTAETPAQAVIVAKAVRGIWTGHVKAGLDPRRAAP